MQNKSSEKLKSKDLITIAIFAVLMGIVQFIISMFFGMIPVTYPFLVSVTLVPVGIIWVYMRVKVPKRGAIFIQSVVLALLLFLIGSGWWITVGFIVGGLAAELISGIGKYRDFKWNTIGYAAFGVLLNFCAFSPILLAADYYRNYCVSNGMDTAYVDSLINFMSWPLLILTTALSIAGAVLGMLLGRLMMRKHFRKAGIA